MNYNQLPKRIEHSCKYLDNIIETDTKISKTLHLSRSNEYTADELIDMITEAQYYFGDATENAERAREVNEELRSSMEYWREEAERLQSVIQSEGEKWVNLHTDKSHIEYIEYWEAFMRKGEFT